MYEGAIDSCFFLPPPPFFWERLHRKSPPLPLRAEEARAKHQLFIPLPRCLFGREGSIFGSPPLSVPTQGRRPHFEPTKPLSHIFPNPQSPLCRRPPRPPQCFLSISGSFDLEKALFSFFPGNKWLFCGGGGLGKRGGGEGEDVRSRLKEGRGGEARRMFYGPPPIRLYLNLPPCFTP